MTKKRERVRLGTPQIEMPKRGKKTGPRSKEERERRSATQKKHAQKAREKYGNAKGPVRRRALMDIYAENGKPPTVVTGPMKPRRPQFVTHPTLAKRMIKHVRNGYPYQVVCKAVNVNYGTFLNWMEKGSQGLPYYVDFFEAICKAEAKAEISTLNKLRKHQRNDWRVSAWELERRWPERWAKKDRVVAEMHVTQGDGKDNKVELGSAVATDENARQLARAMIEGNEFGYERVEDNSDA